MTTAIIENPSDECMREIIIEKDREIERLRERLESAEREIACNWQEYKSRSERPFTAEEILQTLHKGPGRVSRIIFNAKEWEKLLLAFQASEKDAERYRNLKTEYETMGRLDIRCNPQMLALDQIVDALSESEKEA